jgi:hypothetical protein
MNRRRAALGLTACAVICAGAYAQQVRTTPTHYLVCAGVAEAITTAEEAGNILPRNIKAGNNELQVPVMGLRADARFRISQIATDSVRVDIEMTPKEDFRRAARLIMTLERCTEEQIRARDWAIWRFEDGVAPQRLRTVINPGARRAMADIDGNSKYMIAD